MTQARKTVRRAALLAFLLAPALGAALEPRYDHRDLQGPVVEALVAHDTVAISGKASASSWRPALRLGYGWDVLGEGNELMVGLTGTLASWDNPAQENVLLTADLRYRAYFGTEEWKTFFDVGLWAPLKSRVGVGPMVGLGVIYDWSRSGGVFVSGGFSSSFGEARIASFYASTGLQLRF
ncbi:MAG: hypothetical protein QM767_13825 [Anaeromyxobacter sp.]